MDLLFNIMMVSDIETLTSICLSVKNPWCHDRHFWTLKFEHDGLEMIQFLSPTDLSSWRKAYMLSSKVKDLINYLDGTNKIGIGINPDITDILPKFSIFKLDIDRGFYLMIGYDSRTKDYAMNFNKSVHIKYKNLYDVLALMLYHYPYLHFDYLEPEPNLPRQAPRGRQFVNYEDL